MTNQDLVETLRDGSKRDYIFCIFDCLYSQYVAQALTLYKDTSNEVSICMGIHNNETSTYPDCTPKFFNKLFEAFCEGNWDSNHVHAYNPYVEVNKLDVLKDAVDSCEKLGLDINIIIKKYFKLL